MDKQRGRDRYREKIKKEKGRMCAYIRYIARQREVEEKEISN